MIHQSSYYGNIRSIDSLGLHVNITAAIHDSGVEVESKRGNIYVYGFDERKPDGHWYDDIGISYVIWEE